MFKKIRYWGVWSKKNKCWLYKKSPEMTVESANAHWTIHPDLYVVNNTVGVWLDKKKLIKDRENWRLPTSPQHWKTWEIKEFTTVEALKERMRK